jgi:hypothetical protein
MTITYGITEEIYTLGEASRRSFGIAAYADAAEDNTATIVASVHDITSDRTKLEQLVTTCNRSHLSLVHLMDVVEDFLD